MSVAPEVLSLIICDQIITDRFSGKQSLIGMFSVINAFRFPVHHPQLAVFASLTGGHGTVPITIRVVDANEARQALVQGQGQVQFKTPLAVANLALQFHGLRFQEAGSYRVQLSSEGTLLREARLQLVQAKPPPGEGTQAPPSGAGPVEPPPGDDLLTDDPQL